MAVANCSGQNMNSQHFDLDTSWSMLVQHHPTPVIEIGGMLGTQLLTFWLPAACFTICDLLAWPTLQRYKIQPANKQPDPTSIARDAFLGSLSNQLLTTTLHALQLLLFHVILRRPELGYSVAPSLPSLGVFARDFVLCMVAREVIYYYAHRVLHHPLFYTRFHRQHHRFRTPVAMATLYAHPVEHIVTNILPIAWPARLFNVHIVTLWAFVGAVGLKAALAHSGYRLWETPDGWKPEVHDLHHELMTVNYGLIGLMDRVHGTRATEKPKKK
ncbi:Uncharacterized protein PECH_002629 [Penicillium ucsense]|uniref:Fatty acid hydroxylase domain-containing protein n=1 Tax=Penicillium ucsense TaxID=2839758 RepID=A0A8J8W899_9EURO|nr:Uncharacterized protein PECM_000263 [Penicillium ucsense]KAF7730605.1 Uncharacterized protein PECH_002629 [Penicillium ucsense]